MKNWTLIGTREGTVKDFVNISISLNGTATISPVQQLSPTSMPTMKADPDEELTYMSTGVAGRVIEVWQHDDPEVEPLYLLSWSAHKAVLAAFEDAR